MKVIFDSNVWRHISSPHKFPSDPDIVHLSKIRDEIKNGNIEPYISETVFTIESIKRKDRKKFVSNYRPLIVFTEFDSATSSTNKSVIGSSESDHPGNHPILQEHLDDAISLGFRIVRCPRIAGILNPDIENLRYKLSGTALKEYHDKLFDVGSEIEKKGSGFHHIKEIGEKYDSTWFKGIDKAPESEWGNIANAMAEWADGDSVAIAVALDCDYLCTRDTAKGAGTKSVFSVDNLNWLDNDYGFKSISPNDLSNKFK